MYEKSDADFPETTYAIGDGFYVWHCEVWLLRNIFKLHEMQLRMCYAE